MATATGSKFGCTSIRGSYPTTPAPVSRAQGHFAQRIDLGPWGFEACEKRSSDLGAAQVPDIAGLYSGHPSRVPSPESMSDSAHTNALANETSPYLLQHADNPVDWQPWGAEALERARREDKPILLSIGYSACHWCHVMAHESFEDEETARVMNELYVNIKVDREERPDIDKIYQTAHQLLARRTGGWPLTVMLTPDDQAPFFAGTYFPDAPRHGMPSFRQILDGVARLYRERRDDIRRQNASLIEALASLDPGTGTDAEAPPGAAVIDTARAALMQSYDPRHGGFGGAPKFPHPTNIERLMRDYAARPSSADGAAGLAAATFTFRKMCGGGLYDHVGGGFCRYSVDAEWMIPHFEKMLYDNGPLLTVAAELHQVSGDAVFARVARETAAWVMREMQSPEGGYYSTLDADSEGEEGKFYVWTPDEVRGLVADDEYAALASRFGLDRAPNFEGSHWHLHAFREVSDVARDIGATETAAAERIDRALARLFDDPLRPGAPGPRREGPHVVERPDDQGDGDGRAHPRRSGAHRVGRARGGVHPRHDVARRPAARHVQGRPGAVQRISRRLRLPRRRAPRAARIAVERSATSGSSSRSRTRCSGTSRIARTEASSSPPTTTSASSTARSR